MTKYCPECGNEIEAGFKFCTECGKKIIVRPTSCPDCGIKLTEKYKFCPECGKEILPIMGIATTKSKKVEETKPAEKPKPVSKVKSKATKPKISLNFLGKIKRPGKKVLMIISVICIVLVAAAAVVLFYPFSNLNNNGGSLSGGRTFAITIDNNFGSTVSCYLKVGQLRYGEDDYSIQSGDSFSIVVVEDSLNSIIISDDYDITLYVSGTSGESSDTAIDVTESATFEIYDDGGNIGVNCTGSQ